MKRTIKTILTGTAGVAIGAGLSWQGANQLDNVEHQVVRMEHMIRNLVSEIGEWDNLTQEQRDRIEYLEDMIGNVGSDDYYGEAPTGLLAEILRLENELRQANEDAQHLYESSNIWYGYAREGYESRVRIGGNVNE